MARRWEYKHVVVDPFNGTRVRDARVLQDVLNRLDAEGWEPMWVVRAESGNWWNIIARRKA